MRKTSRGFTLIEILVV
ncbi:MAG: prepilin-type N-terminal cleavage/methylation domain-containing protein [Planctomycetota bacterium]